MPAKVGSVTQGRGPWRGGVLPPRRGRSKRQQVRRPRLQTPPASHCNATSQRISRPSARLVRADKPGNVDRTVVTLESVPLGR
jgi:hypothetical protein